MQQTLFSTKFMTGVALVVLSFLIGAITKVGLVLFLYDKTLWNINLWVYGISLVMLFIGIVLCGKEGYNFAKEWYRERFSVSENSRRIRRRFARNPHLPPAKNPLPREHSIYQPREDSFLIKRFIRDYAKGDVLDMGTGSGVLALEAAKTAQTVVAADINPIAVRELRSLAKKQRIRGIRCVETNLFAGIRGSFDLIIFNPPYLPKDKREPVESALQTTGGKKGYELLLRFIGSLDRHLAKDGKCLVIFSDLTNADKIDEALKSHGFAFQVLEREKMFFETLIVYLIERSAFLDALRTQHIHDVRFIAQGKRGEVFRGTLKGKPVAIKRLRKDTEARLAVEREISFTKMLNRHGIGPKYLLRGDDYAVREFVEGVTFSEFLPKASVLQARKVLRQVIRQCATMDAMGISKEEMLRPVKDLLITKEGKAVLIDFERCHRTEKPHNVTQFFQFITRRMAADLRKKGIVIDPAAVEQLLKRYKEDPRARKETLKLLLSRV